MGDLRGSLYDLFGYFIPGLTAGLGLWLIFWTVAWGNHPADLAVVRGTGTLVVLIILLYTLGHLVQAAANAIPALARLDVETALTRGYDPEDRNPPSGVLLSSATLTAIETTLATRFGDHLRSLPARDRFAFIDEARALAERDGDREVYIYHQGFYRGMVIALVVLGLGLLARIVFPRTCLVSGVSYCVGRVGLSFLALFVFFSAGASWRRFHRFQEYRIVRAVMLWLAVTNYSSPNRMEAE